MTINSAMTPEGLAPLPHGRGQPLQVSAAGVNDLAALARQQLPNAVPATSLVAAFNAGIQAPPKSPIRTIASLPSSALAAQFIAQDALGSATDLDIFTPRIATLPVAITSEDSFLQDVRLARGEAPVSPTPNRSQESGKDPLPEASRMAKLPSLSAFSNVAVSIPLVVAKHFARLTLFTARGVGAYQLAEQRNAMLRALQSQAPAN